MDVVHIFRADQDHIGHILQRDDPSEREGVQLDRAAGIAHGDIAAQRGGILVDAFQDQGGGKSVDGDGLVEGAALDVERVVVRHAVGFEVVEGCLDRR